MTGLRRAPHRSDILATMRHTQSRRDFLASASLAAPLAAQPALKIFVLWDMEGTSGVFTREQAWYWENGVRPEVAEEARRVFTSNVNNLSAAALEHGTSELIVCDTHHGGGNLVREQLSADPRIKYEYRSVGMDGGSRRLMPRLDSSVAGLMLPGHHAKAFTERAFLPHTNNIEWADFRINGQSVGEIAIEACYAAHWDVPLIYVEGDEAACYEARRMFPGVVTAAVKQAETAEVCAGLDQKAAHREVARKVAEALEKARKRELKPYKPALPMTITVRMRTMEHASKIARKPGVMLLDDHTVEARVGRHCDVLKWLSGAGLDMPV